VSIYTKSQVHFAKPDALSGSLVDTLKQVNPTAFFGVPRVYEKIEDKIRATAKESSSVKQKICIKNKFYVNFNSKLGNEDRLQSS